MTAPTRSLRRSRAGPDGSGASGGPRRGRWQVLVPLLAAGGLVVALVVVALWGEALEGADGRLYLGAPPLVGRWDPSVGWWVASAAVAAVALVVWWVPATARLPFGRVLAGAWAWSFGWAVLLAVGEGGDRLSAPLLTRFEYLPVARRVGGVGPFLATFVDRLPTYPTHVKGHPPGAVLAFVGLDRLGLGDTAIALVVVAVAASAAPASLVALDRVAGRAAASAAAPFVGLAPAVVWMATTFDALLAGIVAWAVAGLAVAVTWPGRPALVAGGAAGLLAGSVAAMTYGAPVLLGPFWAVALWGVLRRRRAPVAAAAVAALVAPAALALGGFDWLDGFHATRRAYFDGVAPERPFTYFVVANVVVLALAAGPAAVAGMACLRDRAVWWLVGGATLGALAADLSGMSKGEVERIWLPVVPFLVLAAGALPARHRRWWLAAQLAVALGLQVALRSPW